MPPSEGVSWLLLLTVLSQVLGSTGIAEQDLKTNSVLCRGCGMEVADPHYLRVSPLSPHFLERRNVSMFGSSLAVPVELLRNPAGFEFQVISFSSGGCRGLGDWSGEASWYPGYLWRVCVCPQCGAQIGWMFEPEDTVDR